MASEETSHGPASGGGSSQGQSRPKKKFGGPRRDRDGGDRGGDRGGPGGRKKGFFRGRSRKVCEFCVDKNLPIDFKNLDLMRKYINDRGKIKPRRATGCCAKHQRKVTAQVKIAREMALVPYTND